MCGRYYINSNILKKIEQVEAVSGASGISGRETVQGSRRDIRPSETAPVLVKNGKSSGRGRQVHVEWMNWGFPRPEGKNLIINARAENAMEKSMFREKIRTNRCVIPAAGFYEWNSQKEKSEFCREEQDELFLAGFYGEFAGENRFVILTTEANPSVAPVHGRMPLILERDEAVSWIVDDSRTGEFLHKVPGALSRKQEYEQLTLF